MFVECIKSFPERPVIDVAVTPYTREELAARIDYWMGQLFGLTEWGESLG